jgi:hypothetical protein
MRGEADHSAPLDVTAVEVANAHRAIRRRQLVLNVSQSAVTLDYGNHTGSSRGLHDAHGGSGGELCSRRWIETQNHAARHFGAGD